MSEITPLADFLKGIGFSYNSVTFGSDSVTFACLPENTTQIMVPSHGQKAPGNAFDEFYGTQARD